uniref:Terminase n=1 Tax=viral metagenome TaxID=1070528 RepID=A0A6M3JZP2_9ZZZZ
MDDEQRPITDDEAEELVEETAPPFVIEKNTPFVEIINQFSMIKRTYFCFFMFGLKTAEIERLLGRKDGKVYDWRSRDKRFVPAENYLAQHREEYYQQAVSSFLRMIGANTLVGVKILTDKIWKWDELDKIDKQYVWEACKMMLNIARGGGLGRLDEPVEAYEAQIKRLRSNNNAKT